MIRRVRTKLLLINLGVFFMVLIFFITGTYMFMRNNTVSRAERGLQRFSNDMRFPPPMMPGGVEQRRSPNLFYIEIDEKNEVVAKSKDMPLSNNQVKSFVKKALREVTSKGVITYNSTDYRYLLKSNRYNQNHKVIVFTSTDSKKEAVEILLTTFTPIGIVGLLLVLFSSLFLTNNALVSIKESIKKQNNFIADASHELRTPLTIVSTNLEVA